MGALSEEEIDGTPWSLEPLVGVLAVQRHIAPLPRGVASWLTDQRHMGVEPLLHFPLFTIFTQQLPSRGHKRGILSNVSFLSGQAVKYTLTVRASLEGAEQRRFDMKGDEVAWKEILEADSGSKTISQL